MFKKISDTDDNSYHLLSSYHVPGPMLRPVHALVILILTTVPWWINNANSYQVTYLGTSGVISQTRFFLVLMLMVFALCYNASSTESQYVLYMMSMLRSQLSC